MEHVARRSPRHTNRPDPHEELLYHEVRKMSRGTLIPGEPPETKAPILACYGGCSEFTPHAFAGRRPVTDTTNHIVYTELVYRCSCCNHERVYGTESH